MAFEALSEKFQRIIKKIKGEARLSESNMDAMLKEIRIALLEADVNFKVVKEFLNAVKEKSLGEEVFTKLNPSEMVVKIVNDELAKLEPDVEKARERSVQELREHFISKIRNAITNAKIDINELNRVLRKHPFGTDNEVFEFYTQRSKDLLLSGVYRIAMDTNQDTVENNILTEDLDETSQETMKKVFEVLSTNEDDNDFKKLRKELLDYRNYLNYDIKININNSADTLFYSKNQDSKSGGETQTPFYALIAGAFQSVVSLPEKNKLSPCSLVVFDEAFNNMDGERIKQMLEFYKELNIQLIISVPSSRFGYISPFADNIISLAKVDNNVAVFETIAKEER